MSTLREKITLKIESANGNAEQAAIAVCVLLENEIGLAGNGWFDDDEVMVQALSEGDE